jgi:hypothetical protein
LIKWALVMIFEACSLAEDRVQARDRHDLAVDQISQHIPGADGGELVHISYKQRPASLVEQP